MPMLHPITQGSEIWHKMRAGRLTASEFGEILTPELKVRTGEGPEKYLHKKLAERYVGPMLDNGGSWAMGQGSMLEDEALPYFELVTGVKVQKMGLITTDDDRLACSPDGLIGEEGGLEIKCPQPPAHLRYLLAGELPKEYRLQVHGSMLVSGRAWWYFLSYCRAFPPLLLKVERDEGIIERMRYGLDLAVERLDEMAAKIDRLKEAQ